jgi:hypothetical protein
MGWVIQGGGERPGDNGCTGDGEVMIMSKDTLVMIILFSWKNIVLVRFSESNLTLILMRW